MSTRDTPPGYRRPTRPVTLPSLRPARDTDPSPAPLVFAHDTERDAIHIVISQVDRLQDSLEGLRAGQEHAFQTLQDAMRKDRVVMGVITLALSMVLVAVLLLQTGHG